MRQDVGIGDWVSGVREGNELLEQYVHVFFSVRHGGAHNTGGVRLRWIARCILQISSLALFFFASSDNEKKASASTRIITPPHPLSILL